MIDVKPIITSFLHYFFRRRLQEEGDGSSHQLNGENMRREKSQYVAAKWCHPQVNYLIAKRVYFCNGTFKEGCLQERSKSGKARR